MRIDRTRILAISLAVLAIVYGAQIVSPLRLNNDSVRYLAMTQSALAGGGYTVAGEPTYLPSGYSRLLVAAQADTSMTLIVINMIFLAVGMVALDRLLSSIFRFTLPARLIAHVATLTSILFANYSVVPQAESCYFGLSMACLALLTMPATSIGRRLGLLGAATAMAFAAIQVRTVGLALVPAIVAQVLILSSDRNLIETVRKRAGLSIAIAIAVAAATLFLAQRSSYWYDMARLANEPSGIAVHVMQHLAILGQAVLNLPNRFVGTNGFAPLALVGLPVLAALLFGMWRQRARFGAIEVYILSYGAIINLWVDYQTRFWMPVLPILLAYLIELIGASNRASVRIGGSAVFAVYLAFGIAGLAYTTWLSFSGPEFANRYGEAAIRPIYQAAFAGRTLPDADSSQLLVYNVLVHYEPLARRH